MPFVPKKQAFNAHINEVVLGVGDKATAIGGQNVLPFHTFDAEIKNAPKIGVELTDLGMAEYTMPGEKAFYEGCTTVPEMAKRAESLEGASFICLHLEGADPNGLNKSVEEKVGAESAVDINLAKQLNTVMTQLGVSAQSIVMNIGSAAAGYGYEYVASTLDRVKDAALKQADAMLEMPIMTPVSADTWGVKEAVMSEEDMPEWGSQEERGIEMEITTAAAVLAGGSDAVILRHPEAIKTSAKMISALM